MYDCGHCLPEPFPDELADEFRLVNSMNSVFFRIIGKPMSRDISPASEFF